MPRFHELSVTEVRKTTRDAVVVSLAPRDGGKLDFIQGQYLTFRRDFEGTEIRRSYSICSARGDDIVQVGIKRVDGGAFSTWANEGLRAGMMLEAMEPMGSFHMPIDPEREGNYVGFAGGSGITPFLSIIRTVLDEEPGSRFTLVYGNRSVNSIMFREELEDLKNFHMDRLSVVHVLEADVQDIELFTGRVDEQKCDALFAHWIDAGPVDAVFICGPEPMMLGAAAAARKRGVPDDRIKYELFTSSQPGRLARRESDDAGQYDAARSTQATIVIDGTSRSIEMDKGATVLDAAIENAIDAPFACKAGICSTCRCRVLDGKVEMVANHALEDYEVALGYVLACQSLPLTDVLVVDFDQ